MLDKLKPLCELGVLRPLDFQFARFLSLLGADDVLLLAGALASAELGSGHVCLAPHRVKTLANQTPALAELIDELALAPHKWAKALATSPLCMADDAPLKVYEGRLYLSRYFDYEQKVANWLDRAAGQTQQNVPDEVTASLDTLFAPDLAFIFEALTNWRSQGPLMPDTAQAFCAQYFDLSQAAGLDWSGVCDWLNGAADASALAAWTQWVPLSHQNNWQKLACALALGQRFSLISGGPGTGKTTTVTRLLALLVMQAGARKLRIALAAPTGKAAARLTESIAGAKGKLPLEEEVVARIPEQASTLHRLLGVVPKRPEFRHNANNPLHLDVLVVDEASMVDLPLFARLLDALPPHARLILLGDKDQLASVEAGAVLGDICHFLEQGYSQAQARRLSSLTGFRLPAGTAQARIADCLCLLRRSYRFDASSGIGQLAARVNQGDWAGALKVFNQGFQDIAYMELDEASYQRQRKQAIKSYSPYLALAHKGPIGLAEEARGVLKAFNRFRILAALREGPFGVEGLNQALLQALVEAGKLDKSALTQEWFVGRPVMIVQNDHGLGLYNGDIGLCLNDGEGQLRVYFEMADASVKGFLPSRLPGHQSAWAMTVHKSQGSEFDTVSLVFPPQANPVLVRELVYTGITRAKRQLLLVARSKVMNAAVKRKTERASGLIERLNPNQLGLF